MNDLCNERWYARDAARYVHLNCKFQIRNYTHGKSELKVITLNVPRVVHVLSTREKERERDSLAHLKSILNPPERDCVDIRRASFAWSAKMSLT